MLSLLDVDLRGDEEVVEIGCGIGRLTRAPAARARCIYALDVSQEMLTRARRLNPNLDNVNWIHGDGATLEPLPDHAFDACLSFVVFQHIPGPEITLGYISEMARVLWAGGWAAFQISNYPGLHRPPMGVRRLQVQLRALTRGGPRGQLGPAWLGSAISIEQTQHKRQYKRRYRELPRTQPTRCKYASHA